MKVMASAAASSIQWLISGGVLWLIGENGENMAICGWRGAISSAGEEEMAMAMCSWPGGAAKLCKLNQIIIQ